MATKAPRYTLPTNEWRRVRDAVDIARLPGRSVCHAFRGESYAALTLTIRSTHDTAGACVEEFAAQLRRLADELVKATE